MARTQQAGQKGAKANEAAVITEPEESPFRHYVPGERPRADQAYFELLLLRVLKSQGDLPNFDDVWPRAVQALAGMNLLRLSTYQPSEVREAIATIGGEFHSRMSVRTDAIVSWAESFWRIRQIYGSFRQYLRSFDVDGFETLMEDLRLRLTGLSPEFLTGFLRDAGEKVPVPVQERPQRPANVPRPQSPQDRRPSPEQQQKTQPSQGGGQGDRRRRNRQRGGARPQRPTGVPSIATEAAAESKQSTEPGAPDQQQRRRDRRRFFRRRRGGGDRGGASQTPAPGS